MHAGFPLIQNNFFHLLNPGTLLPKSVPDGFEGTLGTLLSATIATGLRDGLSILVNGSHLLHLDQKGLAILKEHFLFQEGDNPASGAFEGKYLIRTRKADDNFNVYLQFCPDPQAVIHACQHNTLPAAKAFLHTESMDETKADQLEKEPGKVDLVIRFKDIQSILGLVGQPEVDVVGLLLQNTVQLTGNVSYLFKLGAIGQVIQQMTAAAK